MKPRVFVGCSVEGIKIANAIQENLEYDANVTIWSQNIFDLTESTLDSLLNSLKNFDFAIFVFNPDDTLILKKETKSVVRDNIIFEFGLFLGRLGKERVSFLVPRNTSNFHLPTDLLGITPGTYDNSRDDNLNASLGPYCNKIRNKISVFAIASYGGFKNSSPNIINILVQKEENWQRKLIIELIKEKEYDINVKIQDLKNGIFFGKTRTFDFYDFLEWYGEFLKDYANVFAILQKMLLSEESELFKIINNGDVNPSKVKYIVDKLLLCISELLNLELEISTINLPNDLIKIKGILRNNSTNIVEEVLRLPEIIEDILKPKASRKGVRPINFTLDLNGSDEINIIINDYLEKIKKN